MMAPSTYTELFFLDEATAFAAGHRPCGECRRSDAKRFKDLWLEVNGALLQGKAETMAMKRHRNGDLSWAIGAASTMSIASSRHGTGIGRRGLPVFSSSRGGIAR